MGQYQEMVLWEWVSCMLCGVQGEVKIQLSLKTVKGFQVSNSRALNQDGVLVSMGPL